MGTDLPEDSTAKLRARARLALRAERAFGLSTLPIRVATQEIAATPSPATPSAASLAPPAKSRPAAALAPPRQTTAPAPIPPAATLLGAQPFTAPSLPAEQKRLRLAALDSNEVTGCTKCRLCERRTNTVFGEGSAEARIFFIGEGPGENEDLQGRPFVGRAGELLNKWIAAMGLRREDVYIANIVKCRPPGNREPAPDEVATCTPYLERQIEIVRPRVIITVGKPAAQHMLQTKNSMGKMRGQWHAWRGIDLMATYHPAYVLRNYTYETRAAVWSDLQLVMKRLGLPLPATKRE